MIRINLLPIKKQRAAASGKNFLVVGAAVLVVELVAIGALHAKGASERDALQGQNTETRTRVDRIKAEISGHDDILAALRQIEARERIIAKLQSARTGPVLIMMELAGILSPGIGPRVPRERLEQMRRDNPLTAPNDRWDARRLWLTAMTEADRVVTIRGQARGHQDIAEFLRRLTVSEYFEGEQLVRTQVVHKSDVPIDLVEFEIHCTARYQ